MSKRANPALIGGFVVGAIALALVATAVIGSGRLFRQSHEFILFFDSDVNGLRLGAPVKFRGVEIGAVKSILLNITSMGVDVTQPQGSHVIPVIIELDEQKIRQKGGHFDFGDPKTIQQTIDAGLRGQLALESFVTGLLYVQLDLKPEEPPRFIGDPSVPLPEIPTIPTPLEEAQMKASRFFMKLEEVDFAGLIASLHSTVEGMDRFVNSPKLASTLESLDATIVAMRESVESIRSLSEDLRGDIGPVTDRLSRTIDTAEAMLQQSQHLLARMDGVMEPDAPFQYQLRMTLDEVATAARAVRVLADSIERNPSVLVRGRATPEEEK